MHVGKILTNLKFAGAKDLLEYDLRRSVCVGVNVLCLSIVILNLISGPLFYLMTGNLSVLVGAVLEAGLVLGIVALNGYKQYELANAALYTIVVLATFYFSAMLGKASETQLMIVVLLSLIFFLFKRRSTQVFCVVISLLVLGLLEANFVYHFIEPVVMTTQVAFFVRWLVYGVVISLLLLIFYLYQKNASLLIRLHTYSKHIDASLLSETRLNEIKDLFFQRISHDIRSAYKGLRMICFQLDETHRRNLPIDGGMIENLMEAKDYTDSMIENFLELSKFKNGSLDDIKVEPFNVREEFGAIVRHNQYLANDRQVRIELDVRAGFPEIILEDKLKVKSILINLLTNAVKFSKQETVVRIVVAYAGECWTLTVIDQGSGMSAARVQRIFLPYETEKSIDNPDGVGLGLYITQYFVRLLGAKIYVDSTVGRGSTFTVTFEVRRELTTVEPVRASMSPPRSS